MDITTDNIAIHRCLVSQPPKGLIWRSLKANKWLAPERAIFFLNTTSDSYEAKNKLDLFVWLLAQNATNYTSVSTPGLTYDHQGELKSPLHRFSVRQEGQVVET